jgi:hypothetical protein
VDESANTAGDQAEPASPTAGAALTAPRSPDLDATAGHDEPSAAEPSAAAEPVAAEPSLAGLDVNAPDATIDGVDAAEIEQVADEDAVADENMGHTMWSEITWDSDASTEDTDAGTGDTTDAIDTGTDEADTGTEEDAEVEAEAEDVLEVGRLAEAVPSEPAEGEPSPGLEQGVEQIAVVPGVPRYHNPDCILIRFMDEDNVRRMTVADAEKAGCTPCRACRPE